jgi:hypothetical protein
MSDAGQAATAPLDELSGILNTPPPPPNTFEFALVMGGTVSAGAYTAGAVDFLIEALDAFAAEKAAGQFYHDVTLKVLCGTSGGAVVAAIAARALAYRFSPCWYGATPPAPPAPVNPLYDVWVRQLDLAPMLTNSDITPGNVPSVLNGSVIDAAGSSIEAYTGGTLAQPRAWVAAPLTVLMTHTNLSGIPIEIDFGGGHTQRFIQHADYIRYAVAYPGQPAYGQPKPYEFTLTLDNTKLPHASSWQDFGNFAMASAAFPLGFPTRAVARPTAHYDYRIIVPLGDPANLGAYKPVAPNWNAVLNNNASPLVGSVRYSAVDGGVADNEPIQLAHAALAGLAGRNPRDPTFANRAVWLIDPFAGQADMGAFAIAGILPSATATLNTMKQQSNYSTADLMLAADPTVYSRYMLAAHRGGATGGAALATGGLGAFLGFACQAFRSHDYYLGRQNCQDFLQNQFRLSADNHVFDAWTAAQKTKWIDADGQLPIIPLFGTAATAETLAPWPAGQLNPETLRAGIDARFNAILKATLPTGFWGGILSYVGTFFADAPVSNYVINLINQALKAANLAADTDHPGG